ncbi:MAG TPA: KamA family radical SAM protein [Sedimentisphaerales bacterium]|nr:KamA family radical SAM protein [Sedimentisphaerales bacterium]HQI26854.1 KamA family radical SAM protein [Sedimentisphaerales bacterium]
MAVSITHPRPLTSVHQIAQLSDAERSELEEVSRRFAFRSNDYYLSLIDWNDPNDPIRRAIVPSAGELDDGGQLDPSNEKAYTILPGLEHKYPYTILLLVSDVCEGICRYCFRKRVFMGSRTERLRDVPAAMEYIQSQKQVTNVLLTGGDPLALETSKLADIIGRLREIEHVQIVRIGSRMPAFNPYRILGDADLLKIVRQYSTMHKKIYLMTHFIHPRELTDVAIQAVSLLQKAGAVTANQAPLLRGINDDPRVLAELLRKLSFIGDAPYYVFQCRPAVGNRMYTVPIEEGYDIVEQAKSLISGLAKRVRYTMSHSSGKIEIVGKSGGQIFLKYHRAADGSDNGRMLVFRSNPTACWLDDYEEASTTPI